MKFTLVIFPDAEAEVIETALYLESCSPGLGDKFLAEYEESLDYIREFAEASPIRWKKFRHILIGRFQVLIVYMIKENEVHVKRVIHSARKVNSRYRE